MESYKELLRYVMNNGESHSDRTGVGTTSVFGAQWRHDMQSGFPLLTTKRVPFRLSVEETLWMLRGQTNNKILNEKNVHIWDEWATPEQCAKFDRFEGDLGPVYGALWRGLYSGSRSGVIPLWRDHNGQGCDQMLQLLTDLQERPNSRRLIVTGWHPRYAQQVELPPCHTLWQIKVHHDESLSLHLYARSIDIFLGLPFDISLYALLLEMIAWVTFRKTRDLVISFGDLHLYNNHRAQAEELLSRDCRQLPTLKIVGDRGRLTGRDNILPQQQLQILESLEYGNFHLIGYDPHPTIKADVAI